MRRMILPSVASPALPHFSTSFHTRHDLRKSYWTSNVCFDFLYNFCFKHFSFYQEMIPVMKSPSTVPRLQWNVQMSPTVASCLPATYNRITGDSQLNSFSLIVSRYVFLLHPQTTHFGSRCFQFHSCNYPQSLKRSRLQYSEHASKRNCVNINTYTRHRRF
jgi:hypothetical protein